MNHVQVGTYLCGMCLVLSEVRQVEMNEIRPEVRNTALRSIDLCANKVEKTYAVVCER